MKNLQKVGLQILPSVRVCSSVLSDCLFFVCVWCFCVVNLIILVILCFQLL